MASPGDPSKAGTQPGEHSMNSAGRKPATRTRDEEGEFRVKAYSPLTHAMVFRENVYGTWVHGEAPGLPKFGLTHGQRAGAQVDVGAPQLQGFRESEPCSRNEAE